MPSVTDAANAERSRLEVASFIAKAPERYFAYHEAKPSGFDPITRLHRRDKITTWTGDVLGYVSAAHEPYRSNFGDVRQSFDMESIDGVPYSGTAYLTAGDYVRMRKLKR